MELIAPQKQRVWKLPAVVNFSCGGLGTGFYLVGLLLMQTPGEDLLHSLVRTAAFKLLGPALVGVGFLALTTEAGRPRRGINLFRHLRRSWMSRETLAAAVFFPAAGLDWLYPHPALRVVAAGAAFALMLCQGFIVYRARGVTAWNNTWMPLFFATSGLAGGSGLMLIVLALFNAFLAPGIRTVLPLPLVALVAAISNVLVWAVYLTTPEQGFQRATEALRRIGSITRVVGVGHLVPALLLAVVLSGNISGGPLFVLDVAAGLTLAYGVVCQKFEIVIEAGYLRPIVLPMPLKKLVPAGLAQPASSAAGPRRSANSKAPLTSSFSSGRVDKIGD
jgi:phenylacetyl-CoA:acceptor oxidoreductase 26-kDa subunit